MKTVQEWMEELPEPYRTSGLNSMITPDEKFYSMYAAIHKGVNWSTTPEGNNQWHDLQESYRDTQPLTDEMSFEEKFNLLAAENEKTFLNWGSWEDLGEEIGITEVYRFLTGIPKKDYINYPALFNELPPNFVLTKTDSKWPVYELSTGGKLVRHSSLTYLFRLWKNRQYEENSEKISE